MQASDAICIALRAAGSGRSTARQRVLGVQRDADAAGCATTCPWQLPAAHGSPAHTAASRPAAALAARAGTVPQRTNGERIHVWLVNECPRRRQRVGAAPNGTRALSTGAPAGRGARPLHGRTWPRSLCRQARWPHLPLPMAMMPSWGSSTSPLPVICRLWLRSATTSAACTPGSSQGGGKQVGTRTGRRGPRAGQLCLACAALMRTCEAFATAAGGAVVGAAPCPRLTSSRRRYLSRRHILLSSTQLLRQARRRHRLPFHPCHASSLGILRCTCTSRAASWPLLLHVGPCPSPCRHPHLVSWPECSSSFVSSRSNSVSASAVAPVGRAGGRAAVQAPVRVLRARSSNQPWAPAVASMGNPILFAACLATPRQAPLRASQRLPAAHLQSRR